MDLFSFLRNKSVKYPFSKFRAYFNAIVAVLAMAFSLFLLVNPLNTTLLAGYFGSTIVVTILMFYVKLRLLFRMEDAESESVEASYTEEAEGPSFLERRWSLITLILLIFSLSLPLLLFYVVESTWWFVGFAGFVTGTSLSEIILYLFAEKS